MPSKLPGLTEKQIQDQIIQYLRMKHFYVQRLNAGQFEMGEGKSRRFIKGVATGTPDLMAFKTRSIEVHFERVYFIDLVFVEVKRPGLGKKSEPTPLQEMKMEELTGYGARCIVAHSIEEMEVQL